MLWTVRECSIVNSNAFERIRQFQRVCRNGKLALLFVVCCYLRKIERNVQNVDGGKNLYNKSSPTDFHDFFTMLAHRISRQDKVMRPAISLQDRLVVVFRVLATGDSYTNQFTFKISEQSISSIIPEVCEAIIQSLKKNIKEDFTYFYYVFDKRNCSISRTI